MQLRFRWDEKRMRPHSKLGKYLMLLRTIPGVDPWAIRLFERKPAQLANVAMAHKTAQIVWAVLTKNEYYRPRSA
ncbi:MAG: hypothetical protein ABJU19_10880 [Roseobacter sp.]